MLINSFNDFFSENVFRKIDAFSVEEKIYNDVLEEIISSVNDLNYDSDDSCFMKMVRIANNFVTCVYEGDDGDVGHYSANVIFLTHGICESELIATIIHELTHHIICEIMGIILARVLDCEKNVIIESFTWYCTTYTPLMILINEFAAHTTENYFLPPEYNSYGSFIELLELIRANKKEYVLTDELIQEAILFGKYLAEDVIDILSNFITDDLMLEIHNQFLKDSREEIHMDLTLDDNMDVNFKYDTIREFMQLTYLLSNNRESIQVLNDIKSNYEYYSVYDNIVDDVIQLN
ncbi:hypothetical protein [Methanosphaera sp. WGK6]|uniref:hypothetical protein n=1 Tax=Methanosphaera sp. WGK6 TaxID=1561964 RepID=UPI00084C2069|nr:hypothetical protein [Methanosphaera sp. WGK6]OED29905.1 hypothetical protein NL43_05705 [Methanosphaera sp. WGK6]